MILIEAWRDFEEENGNEADQELILKNMPARVKKRRKIETADGSVRMICSLCFCELLT